MEDLEENVLEYRRGDARGGCGELVLETLFGMFLAGLCALTARWVWMRIDGGVGVALIVGMYLLVVAGLVYRAWTGKPGMLVGFVIATGVLGSFKILCGRVWGI